MSAVSPYVCLSESLTVTAALGSGPQGDGGGLFAENLVGGSSRHLTRVS